MRPARCITRQSRRKPKPRSHPSHEPLRFPSVGKQVVARDHLFIGPWSPTPAVDAICTGQHTSLTELMILSYCRVPGWGPTCMPSPGPKARADPKWIYSIQTSRCVHVSPRKRASRPWRDRLAVSIGPEGVASLRRDRLVYTLHMGNTGPQLSVSEGLS